MISSPDHKECPELFLTLLAFFIDRKQFSFLPKSPQIILVSDSCTTLIDKDSELCSEQNIRVIVSFHSPINEPHSGGRSIVAAPS